MTTREIEAPELEEIVGKPSRWTKLARIGHKLVYRASVAVRDYQVRRSVPGIAGIALVSAAMGGIFGVWYGVGVLGLFCLRIDSRL